MDDENIETRGRGSRSKYIQFLVRKSAQKDVGSLSVVIGEALHDPYLAPQKPLAEVHGTKSVLRGLWDTRSSVFQFLPVHTIA